jgi:hypothetical protein
MPLSLIQVTEWRLHVEATDMGTPPLASPLPALVIIRVKDLNDEAPRFVDEHQGIRANLSLPTVSGT